MQKSLIKSKIKKNLKKEKDEDTFKCILLGDPNVGKTAVVTRYVDDRFSQHHLTTIGIDMKTKT
jgi:GTPase SAR1 family protein